MGASKVVQHLSTNSEYRHLQKEHAQLESQIELLNRKKGLTDSDESLRKNLQKKKLAGRDRMEQIERQYQDHP